MVNSSPVLPFFLLSFPLTTEFWSKAFNERLSNLKSRFLKKVKFQGYGT